ncbi:MAG TPA: hypothetical protein VF085_12115 [Solirubrobacterales bacterium]
MGAKVWTGLESRAAHLRRLAVVFSAEIRLRIVTELYMREMSPTQFFEEFGGGTVSRVDYHFKKLAKARWLRHHRSTPGKNGRGVMNFYRASELAYFDAETWALLPYSIRVAFSWSSFKVITERAREAMAALAAEGRATRNLTSGQLLLDQLGWKRVIEAVDTQFVSLYEEQDDAALRISHSKEKPIRVSVLQFAFESPTSSEERIGPELVESEEETLTPFPVRLSKVFADELSIKILTVANQRDISVEQFCAEFGGPSIRPRHVRRRFAKLEQNRWMERVHARLGSKRRSTREYFYRATGPVITDDVPQADVPDSLRETDSWKTFEQLSVHVKEALKAGTFDAREDRYLAWSLLLLDQQGLERVAADIEALRAFVLEEQKRAKARLRKTGEKPITTTVALGAFESPVGSIKEP